MENDTRRSGSGRNANNGTEICIKCPVHGDIVLLLLNVIYWAENNLNLIFDM